MPTVAIIPARYGSSRLPGKALADIGGMPMIWWVWRAACQASKVERVIVATDDQRIQDAVTAFGGESRMTSPNCRSGTDRVAEVAANLDCQTIVNIQGDEPFLDPLYVDAVVETLHCNSWAEMATLAAPIQSPEHFANPSVVKCVLSAEGRALYFSREPIPHCRDATSEGWRYGLHHLGIYSYRKTALLRLAALPVSALEGIEKLEQLRALESGMAIAVAQVERSTVGVDTPQDLEMARLLAQNTKEERAWQR
jgi:3-deoxy-manno-octulosonate cytidylyltransferase (CMP-KDO synthetase)